MPLPKRTAFFAATIWLLVVSVLPAWGQAVPAATDSFALLSKEWQLKIAQSKKAADEQETINGLVAYGKYCNNAGKFNQAADCFREVLQIASDRRMTRLMAESYLRIGEVLYRQSLIDSTLYYAFKALEINESLKSDSVLSAAYGEMGAVYNVKKEYPKSFELYSKALHYAERGHLTGPVYIIALVRKALAYSWLKKPYEAAQLQLKALPLAEKEGLYDYLSTCKMNLANNYVMLHEYDKAKGLLKDLVKDMASYQLTSYFYCRNMAIIGLIYKDMGDIQSCKYFLNQQIPLAHQLKAGDVLQRLYDTLSVIAEQERNYSDALKYVRLSQRYKDTIAKETNSKMVSELEVKYQTAQKEKDLSQKKLEIVQKEAQLQKTRLLVALAFLVVLLLYFKYNSKRKEHRRQLHTLQQERELQLLQALMQGEEKERSRIAKDLHDGVAGMLAAVKMHFNSLAFHHGPVLQSDGYRQGVQLLDEATVEVRQTSHNLMPEVLLQHGLEEALSRYCGNISNRHTLTVQYDSWGDIGRYLDSFELSVYRIVQELLNNVVKHSRATEAVVQLSAQGGVLAIAIEDNGVGYSKGQLPGDGMGLSGLQSRVQALNGRLQLAAEQGSGVSAYLEFDTAGLKKEKTVPA